MWATARRLGARPRLDESFRGGSDSYACGLPWSFTLLPMLPSSLAGSLSRARTGNPFSETEPWKAVTTRTATARSGDTERQVGVLRTPPVPPVCIHLSALTLAPRGTGLLVSRRGEAGAGGEAAGEEADADVRDDDSIDEFMDNMRLMGSEDDVLQQAFLEDNRFVAHLRVRSPASQTHTLLLRVLAVTGTTATAAGRNVAAAGSCWEGGSRGHVFESHHSQYPISWWHALGWRVLGDGGPCLLGSGPATSCAGMT